MPAARSPLAALTLGGAATGVVAGAVAWVWTRAGANAAPPVAMLGAAAVLAVAIGVSVRQLDVVAAGLALAGAAYAVVLAVDHPALDLSSALLGAVLLAAGELSSLSLDARAAATPEGGTLPRRLAFVAVLTLVALALGAVVLAVADLVRTGGLGVEMLGVAAAVAAVALLVAAARDAAAGRAGD